MRRRTRKGKERKKKGWKNGNKKGKEKKGRRNINKPFEKKTMK